MPTGHVEIIFPDETVYVFNKEFDESLVIEKEPLIYTENCDKFNACLFITIENFNLFLDSYKMEKPKSKKGRKSARYTESAMEMALDEIGDFSDDGKF